MTTTMEMTASAAEKTLAEKLREIRSPKGAESKAVSAAASGLILLLGTALGAFAKWLDLLEINDGIWWHRLIERFGLAREFSDLPVWLFAALVIAVMSRSPFKAAVNVLFFFAGMDAAYHVWTITHAGFDPGSYMLIWYGLTAVSPLIAAVCWYARGKGIAAAAVSCVILAGLAATCFSFGWVYFSFKTVISTLVFAAGAAVLYRSPAQTAATVPAAIVLAFFIAPLYPLG